MDRGILVTPYSLAERYIGLRELPGAIADQPFILAMLKLDTSWPEHDEVPWCSAFVNFVCWQLRLSRSKSLRARSWLEVGTPIPLDAARPGFDVVVLKQQREDPGNQELNARGHVGFFAGWNYSRSLLHVLGGNQSNSVTVSTYPSDRFLDVRRITLCPMTSAGGFPPA